MPSAAAQQDHVDVQVLGQPQGQQRPYRSRPACGGHAKLVSALRSASDFAKWAGFFTRLFGCDLSCNCLRIPASAANPYTCCEGTCL